MTNCLPKNLDSCLNIRANEFVTWSGKYRPALRHLPVYPRPVQDPLPIWIGVGGTPESFIRAGSLGLPLMVAVIGGETRHFRPLVDLYREAGNKSRIYARTTQGRIAFIGLYRRHIEGSNR